MARWQRASSLQVTATRPFLLPSAALLTLAGMQKRLSQAQRSSCATFRDLLLKSNQDAVACGARPSLVALGAYEWIFSGRAHVRGVWRDSHLSLCSIPFERMMMDTESGLRVGLNSCPSLLEGREVLLQRCVVGRTRVFDVL